MSPQVLSLSQLCVQLDRCFWNSSRPTNSSSPDVPARLRESQQTNIANKENDSRSHQSLNHRYIEELVAEGACLRVLIENRNSCEHCCGLLAIRC